MELSKEDLRYMAKACEKAQDYPEMLNYVRKIIDHEEDLSSEERSLLSTALKEISLPKRISWRALTKLYKAQEDPESQRSGALRTLRTDTEKDLHKFCQEYLKLIDESLLPRCEGNVEGGVAFLKMKGDLYRYIAESSQGDSKQKAADNALQFYTTAQESAGSTVKVGHPLMLSLALNYAILFYEVMEEPAKAIEIAHESMINALSELDQIEENIYKDSTHMLQILKDNISMWKAGLEGNHDESEED